MERDMLLELIKKYQNIIDNKETKNSIVLKKREAWESVCHQYNAVAVSGFRTWQQLRHLYENIKQRSKKNVVKDNKEINRTGDGANKSTVTMQDAQILGTVAPQVQPLCIPINDAASYFGDDNINEKETEHKVFQLMIINDDDIDHHQATAMTVNSTVAENSKPCTSNVAGQTKPKRKESTIKEEYFKAKLNNANLERKYIINKNRMEINKYKMEMQILKLKLKKQTFPRNH